jgi:mannose-6-phosphate isomerase-like protein (cupin superfamily)
MKKNRKNSEHYSWGDNCLGWKLVDSPQLSIIEEEMPPGTQEAIHHHNKANQFFYVLEGTALFQVGGKTYSVEAKQGIFIEAGSSHTICNRTENLLKFLVVSNPTTKNDRHEEIV